VSTLKINAVKLAAILGTVLSVGGTLLTGWAGEKKTQATIAKMVEDKLSKM
jgi:hypothetical protein